MSILSSLATAVAAGLLSWTAIAALRPWLARVAAAKPSARSSHRTPTPQGAGLGVVASLVIVGSAATLLAGAGGIRLVALLAAILGLTALGFIDDMRPLAWRPKLLAQVAAAALAVASLPPESTLVPGPLYWLERAGATLALVATVNIVNFIDGIDEITVAHSVPALALAGAGAMLVPQVASVGPAAAAGLGAMLGFWVWNRHPAAIFLGDSGSLPLGLLLGWLALTFAVAGQPAVGLLMLLYPLTDGTLTLVRRSLAGRTLTEPHRDHAYQRAVDSGLSPRRVALTVALSSAACALLALTALVADHALVSAGCLAIGGAWVLSPIIGWLRGTGAR